MLIECSKIEQTQWVGLLVVIMSSSTLIQLNLKILSSDGCCSFLPEFGAAIGGSESRDVAAGRGSGSVLVGSGKRARAILENHR